MFIRCAFFRGQVKPGCEDAFASYIRDRLVPLWTRFPGAEEVRVMRQDTADEVAPRLELVLAMRFPSREAIDVALASGMRSESREVSAGLISMFKGDIFHTIFRADEYPLLED